MHGRPVVMLPPVPGADGRPERFRALVHFQPGPDRVFALLSQVTRAPEYRDELSSVEPVSFGKAGAVVDYHLRILFMDVHYRVRHSFDPQRRILHWELDPDVPNDLAAFEGSWELRPAPDGGTLGRFTTKVRIGSAFPAVFQDGMTRRRVPKGLDATRRWVDAQGEERR